MQYYEGVAGGGGKLMAGLHVATDGRTRVEELSVKIWPRENEESQGWMMVLMSMKDTKLFSLTFIEFYTT